MTLGTPSKFVLQQLLLDQARISGFREKRSEQPLPGQELGLKGTIGQLGQDGPAGQASGYERFELNFGKQIPSFKTYNSMMPLWQQLDHDTGNAIHLLALYSTISGARKASPALRSSEGWFLRLRNNTSEDQIFGVGKVQKIGAEPDTSDVVFAFVNLALGADSATPNGDGFDVDIKSAAIAARVSSEMAVVDAAGTSKLDECPPDETKALAVSRACRTIVVSH